jgi:RimJ/RimL family protein N-acetyltransferase
MRDIYRGELVRLAVEAPEAMAKAFARWNNDSECHRLADSEPAQLWSEKKFKEFIEKEYDKDPRQAFRFSLRTLEEDKLIGYIGLVPMWVPGDAWAMIVIGERSYWDRGYGTDAMRLILQYGFLEANLRRITLGLHSYNERALRAYQKVGFKMEGTVRGEGLRDGHRYDGYYMGILREEWLALLGSRT